MNGIARRHFRVPWTNLLWLTAATAIAGDWPAFRGPDGNGIALEDRVPLPWGPGKNVRWQVTLPGPGNSGPIVSRGRVFITFAQDDGKKRNLYCPDRRTGERLCVRTEEFPGLEPTHRSNPYFSAPTRTFTASLKIRRDDEDVIVKRDPPAGWRHLSEIMVIARFSGGKSR